MVEVKISPVNSLGTQYLFDSCSATHLEELQEQYTTVAPDRALSLGKIKQTMYAKNDWC